MFRLHKNASMWGKNLIDKNGPIKFEFDLYYVFLLVGLGMGSTELLKDEDSREFTRWYPKTYQPTKHKIAMLLLYSDLKVSGFDVENREIVKSKIEEILSSDSESLLSDIAVKQLNNYANGGFEVIRGKLDIAPRDATLFLTIVYDEIFPELFNF